MTSLLFEGIMATTPVVGGGDDETAANKSIDPPPVVFIVSLLLVATIEGCCCSKCSFTAVQLPKEAGQRGQLIVTPTLALTAATCFGVREWACKAVRLLKSFKQSRQLNALFSLTLLLLVVLLLLLFPPLSPTPVQ